MRKLGLYIHLPFCVQKCLYCDFCSFAGCDNDLMRNYVSRLCADIELWSERCTEYSVDTVYFGGGTPTLLPISEFCRLMEAIERGFGIDKNCEISSECNPATADREYLRSLRNMGVNRLSIGLQSANGNELKAIGRIHSYADFVDTYKNARSAGFDNISADLMYGIPEQSVESFDRSLGELISLEPEHISAYGLKIEEGTPFGRMRDRLILPDEDSEYDMYMLCSERLERSGYYKYEISNFAHKGYESRHNIKYWMGDEYLGLGVSAHSYFGERRFANSNDVGAYIRGTDITSENRYIPSAEQMTEYVMLRMRMSAGVQHSDFSSRFGKDFETLYQKKLDRYVKQGFVISDGGRTFFSDRGFFVSNYILSDILDFE